MQYYVTVLTYLMKFCIFIFSSIQKQIASASGARKFFALTLIKISLLYMDAKRIYEVSYLIYLVNDSIWGFSSFCFTLNLTQLIIYQ